VARHVFFTPPVKLTYGTICVWGRAENSWCNITEQRLTKNLFWHLRQYGCFETAQSRHSKYLHQL